MQEAWWLAATSIGMWIIGFITAGNALLQTFLFYGTIRKTGQKLQLSEVSLRRAITASLITAIGPCLGIFIGMIVLVVALGGAVAFIRESAGVGSIMFELIAAQSGADAAGAELTREGMTGLALGATLFAMASGSVAWVIIGGVGTRWLPQLREKMGGGDPTLVGLMSVAIMLGAFGRMFVNDDIWPGIYALLSLEPSRGFSPNLGNLVAGVVGFIVAVLWLKYSDQAGKPWLKEYFMLLAIILGVVIAAFV